MVSQPVLSSLQKLAAHNLGVGLKGTSLHRAHYSAPSGGGYHQHHHVYHTSGGEGHSYSDHGSGKKRSIALSALTLLAFLFFLNILQNCLDEQMETTTPQVIVMTSRLQQLKEAEQRLGNSQTGVKTLDEDIQSSEKKFPKQVDNDDIQEFNYNN